jgi:Ser/Thr protein kinase RdoA (MazF antagonist)
VSKQDFYNLTPTHVLAAVDQAGFRTTGGFLQLNSYENRVFDVAVEPDATNKNSRVIAKFYRPHRWSRDAILEEHLFLENLRRQDLPVVCPLRLANQETLITSDSILVACFEKARGRLVQEFTSQDLRRLGRTLAQIHTVGQSGTFKHRPQMVPKTFIDPVLEKIEQFCTPELWPAYAAAATAVHDFLSTHLDEKRFIRIHGDCHRGNVLDIDQGGRHEFFLVDFDDCVMGPVAQDFWMLFSGDETESADDLEALLAGYLELRNLAEADLEILPGLRGQRIIHMAGWIARRWEDPSFPRLFPHFQSYEYWRDEVRQLTDLAETL